MSRIEDNEPAVLPREASRDLPKSVEMPPALAAREAEWLAFLDQLPPRRRRFREIVGDGLRRVWDGPPEEPLTDEEVRSIMQPEEEELPELVPPDDPERLAWEAHLRSLGIRPATRWGPRSRKPPLRRPTLWQKIKYRVSRGW